MGEVEGTKPAQTILDRGVFLRSRAEAPYFIVLFIYLFHFRLFGNLTCFYIARKVTR